LIDESLKPWLIEVNNNTSLIGDSPFDETIKLSVVKGALEIVNLKRSFKRKVMARQSRKGQISLFDGRKELERSLATNWRQILPIDESDPKFRRFKDVLGLYLSSISTLRRCRIGQSMNSVTSDHIAQRPDKVLTVRTIDDRLSLALTLTESWTDGPPVKIYLRDRYQFRLPQHLNRAALISARVAGDRGISKTVAPFEGCV
jgi:hypothetical protein